MSPSATIIVTAFDREDSLKRLLLGLNIQSVAPENYEVVIADDSGDTRMGDRVMAELSPQYALSLVRTKLPYGVNGVSVARNLGIQKAGADIIISIDDDCFPCFFFVEEHLLAHRRPYPVIVLGHRSCEPSKLKEDRPISVTELKSTNELTAHSADMLNYSNFMTGNVSLPRQVALETGLFDEIFAQPGEHGYEDIEFGYRLWRRGIPTVFSRNAMIYRPETEPEKEQHRMASKAMVKASQRLLKLHPLVPKIKAYLGAAYKGSTEEAVGIGSQIISSDPEHWPVRLLQADLLNVIGCYDQAEMHLNTALELYDLNPAVHHKLAECKFRQKRYDEAAAHTSKTLEMAPKHTKALYLVALLKPLLAQGGHPAFNGSIDINVEMGGGTCPTKIRSEGQDDYINLDALGRPTVDVRTDFTNALPFPDGAVNRIFSREMIAHLPYKRLPDFIKECHRVMAPGGELYLCCSDFESILSLYAKQCDCFDGASARSDCPRCGGNALLSHQSWRSNLLGDQNDHGDGGYLDTHKNIITFGTLASLMEQAGFIDIERDRGNPYYDIRERLLKLSVKCRKPVQNH